MIPQVRLSRGLGSFLGVFQAGSCLCESVFPHISHLVVSKGMDGCLFVYAIDDWKVFEAKLASLPLINVEARQFARYFLSGAQYVTVDKQGRILMPQDLREFAGLEKDVVLAGMGGRIEIWSLDKWNANSEQVDINKISEGMINLGLTI